jgi:hypothetical protein
LIRVRRGSLGKPSSARILYWKFARKSVMIQGFSNLGLDFFKDTMAMAGNGLSKYPITTDFRVTLSVTKI